MTIGRIDINEKDLPKICGAVIQLEERSDDVEDQIATIEGEIAARFSTPQGRLTLQIATPVMTTTNSGAGFMIYTPYTGNRIGIYDGTSVVMTEFAETYCATTDTTKNPSAIGASKVNDWFVWNDAGTVRLSHGPDWTNDTTRSAGTALVMVNGVYLNNASITNGPAASRGTYVGTSRSNGSSLLDWIFGALSANGTAGMFGVWNYYNRETVCTTVKDSTDGYSYTTATWRSVNASDTMRVSFVVGLNLACASATYTGIFSMTGLSNVAAVGVGFDATNAFTGTTGPGFNNGAALLICGAVGRAKVYPGIGFHFFQAIEYGQTGVTFAGDDGRPTVEQAGLDFEFLM